MKDSSLRYVGIIHGRKFKFIKAEMLQWELYQMLIRILNCFGILFSGKLIKWHACVIVL
jgi:flavorubredoxin